MDLQIKDVIVSKVQKHLDTIRERNTKLIAENAKLKEQLAALKTSSTRIRRIPKKTVATETTEEEATQTA